MFLTRENIGSFLPDVPATGNDLNTMTQQLQLLSQFFLLFNVWVTNRFIMDHSLSYQSVSTGPSVWGTLLHIIPTINVMNLTYTSPEHLHWFDPNRKVKLPCACYMGLGITLPWAVFFTSWSLLPPPLEKAAGWVRQHA
jgi:hypothetical protein